MSKIKILTGLFLILLISSCNFSFLKRTPSVSYLNDPDLLFNRALSEYKKGKYEKAAQDFQQFINRYPLDERIIEAQIKYADSLYKAKKYIEAEEAYLEFIRLHPKNKLVPYCYYQLGVCEYAQISTIDRDQSKVISAYKYFRTVVENYPNTRFAIIANHRILECKRKMAKYNFYVGYFYYKTGYFKAAIYRFKKVLIKYPGFIDDKVLFFLAKSYMDLKKPYIAKKIFKKLMATFPKSRYSFYAKRYIKNLKPEKFTLISRLINTIFGPDVEDVHDKYFIPGYKKFAYPPAIDVEKILEYVSKEKRTIWTFKGSPEIKKQIKKAEVKSRKETKEDKIPINISANNVKYLNNGQQVVFSGNVVATKGDFSMTSNVLTAYLETPKKRIQRIEALGDVKIIYLTKYATCEKAEYIVPEGKVILTGNPVMKDGGNIITGDKIVYFIKTQQIFVQGSRKKRGEIEISP